MTLKLERTAARVLLLPAGSGPLQLQVLVNRHTVLLDGDNSVFDLFSRVHVLRARKVDVVGLPC